MKKQEILTDLGSIPTLCRRLQVERATSMMSAIGVKFESELDWLIEDLRAECVAEFGPGGAKWPSSPCPTNRPDLVAPFRVVRRRTIPARPTRLIWLNSTARAGIVKRRQARAGTGPLALRRPDEHDAVFHRLGRAQDNANDYITGNANSVVTKGD